MDLPRSLGLRRAPATQKRFVVAAALSAHQRCHAYRINTTRCHFPVLWRVQQFVAQGHPRPLSTDARRRMSDDCSSRQHRRVSGMPCRAASGSSFCDEVLTWRPDVTRIVAGGHHPGQRGTIRPQRHCFSGPRPGATCATGRWWPRKASVVAATKGSPLARAAFCHFLLNVTSMNLAEWPTTLIQE
jgi:hypothetical protein